MVSSPGSPRRRPGLKCRTGCITIRCFLAIRSACRSHCRTVTVEYTDGTPNTLPQEAHDVVTFLSWAANPETVERKQIGVRVILFLVFMTGLTYAVKRKVWSDVHH